ncbi:energy-coupling factor ABC transporter ATP-binding protein [Ruminiclostridium cellulolyticum]|uniref:Cobalt ABC transporter, ATPase subunit n=1 Tax=Ruminiclostridium cellulolyticum (strain ATCC 35319 / DSM 5812 / JCM 6584 / H10) TaxID=394503 RepID=B8I041_RUMCH|nr:ABC transporter ATP-binding protein [Ruminiclostridium cellulolyticum]ACL75541.1 cobalt ABC transporter, ATPase subunit [Ruminiclostridium cellulolyticum H10]
MSHHKIELEEVSFSYPDGHQALDDITFLLGHGESVGVVGANGAGKSTLLSILSGILFPQKGNVRIGDIPVTKKTLAEVRRSIGLVFQEPDDQLFMTSVYDDVAFGPRNYQLDEKEVEERVNHALEEVGIPHLKDRPPYKLSGGEKKLAAIAAVISMEPDILIMDEPTASLDPKARRKIMNILKGFRHTKIITSHDLDMIMDMCERTIVLKNGKIAADGPTTDILGDSGLMERCGLELPLAMQNCPVCGKTKPFE